MGKVEFIVDNRYTGVGYEPPIETLSDKDFMAAHIEALEAELAECKAQREDLMEGRTCAAWLGEGERLRTENAAVKAKLEKFIRAVGLASTNVPTMEIDVNDPIGMMHKVCNEVKSLRARCERLVEAAKRVKAWIEPDEHSNPQADSDYRLITEAIAEMEGKCKP